MCATKSPFAKGGIIQPCTFQGLISFFLVPGGPFHGILLLHILIQPFCPLTFEATIGHILQGLCYNLTQLNALQNPRQLLIASLPGTVYDQDRIQNLLPQNALSNALWFWG